MSLADITRPARRLSILLLCDDDRGHANTILDHVSAFVDYSRHEIHLLNPRGLERMGALRLEQFDVVIIHYSLCVLYETYLPRVMKEALRRFTGLKVQFIQDDYRWVDGICAVMRDIGIDVLFTLVPPAEISRIWDENRLPGVLKVTTLAGYVPERLVGLMTPPVEARPIDIGYRGRMLPFWLGRIAQEKAWIAQGVLARSAQHGLRCDIAWREEDRVYGKTWDEFLSSCKATLGTESGATIADFDGSIEAEVRAYLNRKPEADFEEIFDRILHKYEGNVRMNVISPKIFESIALHTTLILFPGDYSGILSPWVHYIPLEKDYSNMAEVAAKLRDGEFLREMTTRAYDDIVASGRYSYRTFIGQFDDLVDSWPKVGHVAAERRQGAGARAAARGTRAERHVRIRVTLACRCLEDYRPSRLQGRIGTFLSEIMAGSHGEALLVLRALGGSAPLRRVVLSYLRGGQRRTTVSLKGLLKEVLLWRALQIAYRERPSVRRPFRVRADVKLEEGEVSFTSVPTDPSQDEFDGSAATLTQSPDDRWSEICNALIDGRLKRVLWDHSPIGVYISCRVGPLVSIGVGVGDRGQRIFTNMIELTRGE